MSNTQAPQTISNCVMLLGYALGDRESKGICQGEIEAAAVEVATFFRKLDGGQRLEDWLTEQDPDPVKLVDWSRVAERLMKIARLHARLNQPRATPEEAHEQMLKNGATSRRWSPGIRNN